MILDCSKTNLNIYQTPIFDWQVILAVTKMIIRVRPKMTHKHILYFSYLVLTFMYICFGISVCIFSISFFSFYQWKGLFPKEENPRHEKESSLLYVHISMHLL